MPPASDGTDLAIVNEQVGEVGGTERVLAALLDRYPNARVLAPRFRSVNVAPEQEPEWASRVIELGHAGRKRHHLAPIYARRIAAATVGPARVVLTLVHGGWGAAVEVPPGARHVCYSAGLPRGLYGDPATYVRGYPAAVRPLLLSTVPALRAHYRRVM